MKSSDFVKLTALTRLKNMQVTKSEENMKQSHYSKCYPEMR